MSRTVWRLAEGDRRAENELTAALGVGPLIARLLVNRGYATVAAARSFLSTDLSGLPEPTDMQGMERAADRVMAAIASGERIVIYGDYDVDGVTATTVMVRFLAAVGANVDYALPEREKDGYGLKPAAIARLADIGTKLLITVDNGVSAHEAVEAANAAGIDVVVTDHHQMPQTPVAAYAVVNPRLDSPLAPTASLAGVGVAFELARAIRSKLLKGGAPKEGLPHLGALLDCVAVGSIADCVPLVGVNRTLVTNGLKQLARTRWTGLTALMAAAGVAPDRVEPGDIAFGIAPRINAAGRMGSAAAALGLMLADDPHTAARLARELEEANRRRRELQEKIYAEAMGMIDPEQVARDRAVVAAGYGWKTGVVGIVAAKTTEKFGTPSALVAFDGDGPGRGSVRSVPGFNAGEALAAASAHLMTHGGHPAAAGFTVAPESYEAFRGMFIDAARTALADVDTRPETVIDAVVDPAAFDVAFIEELAATMGPFGEGNRTPVFLAEKAPIQRIVRMGKEKNHARLSIYGVKAEVVAFGFADEFEAAGGEGSFDLVFTPTLNHFNGVTRPQLRLIDMSPHAAQARPG